MKKNKQPIHPELASAEHPQCTSSAATSGEPSDEQLMGRIQRHDESALAVLHQRHRTLLRAVIGRMISNDQDIDDVEQQCLLQVWRLANSYCVKKGQALGWVVTLTRRRTIDYIRRRSAYRRAQDRFRDASTTTEARSCRSADEEAVQSDTAEIVGQMIENLPRPQQQAVRLTYFRGMSQRQVAAHTGIPLGTIKTRLELALRKLRSSVLAFGELREALQPTRV